MILRSILAAVLSSAIAVLHAGAQTTVRSVRTVAGGTPEVTRRIVDTTRASIQAVQPDGRVVEMSWSGERRVLVQLRARPRLDRAAPGSGEELQGQLDKLVRDLATIDARVKIRKPSRIHRRYERLFAGVAATVRADAANEIRRLPYVAAVYEDVAVHACLTESVPIVGAPEVWSSYGVSGAGVKVAVIDTGIDYTHPDLGGCLGSGCRVAGGWDFVNDDADPRDDAGHGTHVAGIIAANGTLKGVAPGATLLAYKVLDATGNGSLSDIIAALERALQDGARVANLSLGAPGNPDDPLSVAIDNATAAGLLSVCAAGNEGAPVFPATGVVYRSVGSPGVARTALTVGAVDKARVMAGFSSRGYVIDGGRLIMKPELVAPGVSIRSTVPLSGPISDPSGYKALNGTSMATPHVAGAAALLLQWNGAQSPGDLKARLVGSARGLGNDPFSEGAGLLDLVAAFRAPFLPSATHVPFGIATTTSGVVSFQQTLSIRNTTATAQSLTVSADATLPAGATLSVTPSSAMVAAGGTTTLLLQLNVDTALTPPAAQPLSWYTRLNMTNGAQTTSVPLYFFKGGVLNLAFDAGPAYVAVINPQLHAVRSYSYPQAAFSDVVEPGAWDVLSVFTDDADPTLKIVAREQLNVADSLSVSVARADASNSLQVLQVDDTQHPLRSDASFSLLALALKRADAPELAEQALILTAPSEFRVSNLSSRYVVGLIGGGPDPDGSRFFSYSWSGLGVSSGRTLPVSGLPMRTLAMKAARPQGASWATIEAALGYSVVFSGHSIGRYFSVPASTDPLLRTFYLQSGASPDLPAQASDVPLLMNRSASLLATTGSVTSQAIVGPYLRHTGGDTVILDNSDTFRFFELFGYLYPPGASPPWIPIAVLDASTTQWDIDLAPRLLELKFRNNASKIAAYTRQGMPPFWLTQTDGLVTDVSAAPQFSLYRNDTLVSTHALASLVNGIATTPGGYEIRATRSHAIGSVIGISSAVVAMDTSRSDANPPYVRAFRVEQNGQRTATPVTPSASTTTVSFDVTDDTSLAAVVLEWRETGNAAWAPMTLAHSGSSYTAPLTNDGSTDLRLTATDGAGNSFQQTWSPAVIACLPPVITIQPQPPQDPNQTPMLSVGASGSGLSYQWYAGQSGNTASPVAGGGEATVVVAPATVSTSYWVRVSNGCGSVDSNTVTVTCAPASITAQPISPPAIIAGNPAQLSVTAAGTAPLYYQWYAGPAGDTTSALPLGTTAGVTVSPMTTTSYWVRVSASCGSVDSASATVTVSCTPAVLTSQPTALSTVDGYVLTAAGTGTAPLFYQWYVDAGSGFTAIAGATNASVTVAPATASAAYRVRVSNACGSVDSTPITLTCTAVAITSQPPSPAGMFCSGAGGVSLGAGITGSHPRLYQWYAGASGNTSSAVPNGTGSTLNVTIPPVTTSYWVRVRNSCSTVDSATATVNVMIPATIATQPVSPPPVFAGDSTQLSVAAEGGSPSYQWYTGNSGNQTSPVPNGTGPSLTVSPQTTTSYWVKVSNQCAIANSATVTVTVCPSITITQPAAAPATINAGQSTQLSVSATGSSPLSYQWYAGSPPNTSSPVPNGTTPALAISPASTTSYWVRVSNSCGHRDSAAVVVTVRFATPSFVAAARTGESTILVSWGAAPSGFVISEYRVERLSAGQFVIAARTSGTSFVDSIENGLLTGHAYFYRVYAVDAQGVVSPPTAWNVATLVGFQNDPAVAGVTTMRGAHIDELRSAVDAVRQAAGLSLLWASAGTAAGKPVTESGMTALLNGVNDALVAVQLPPRQFSVAVAQNGRALATQLQELRDAVK